MNKIKSTRGTWKLYGRLPNQPRSGRSRTGWLEGFATGLVFVHTLSGSEVFGIKNITKDNNRLGNYQIDHIPTGMRIAITPRQTTARHIVRALLSENADQWLFTNRNLSRKHRDQLKLSLERAKHYAWAKDNGIHS